jgi:flagellar hook-basal body complex protein FliE
MINLPTMVITPQSAVQAYSSNAIQPSSLGGDSFSASLEQAMEQAAEVGHTADKQSMKAISGDGNLTEVVTALSRAQLTLATVTTIRDKVVQAYQDIMKMPI